MLTYLNITSGNINHTIMATTSAINVGNTICHSNFGNNISQYKTKNNNKWLNILPLK